MLKNNIYNAHSAKRQILTWNCDCLVTREGARNEYI